MHIASPEASVAMRCREVPGSFTLREFDVESSAGSRIHVRLCGGDEIRSV